MKLIVGEIEAAKISDRLRWRTHQPLPQLDDRVRDEELDNFLVDQFLALARQLGLSERRNSLALPRLGGWSRAAIGSGRSLFLPKYRSSAIWFESSV